jgi:hypothetical protein
MSDIGQFEQVVTEAGAEAIRIMRDPSGVKRLVIQTTGGLITREVPLRGDLGKDIQGSAFRLRKSLPASNALRLRQPET